MVRGQAGRAVDRRPAHEAVAAEGAGKRHLGTGSRRARSELGREGLPAPLWHRLGLEAQAHEHGAGQLGLVLREVAPLDGFVRLEDA